MVGSSWIRPPARQGRCGEIVAGAWNNVYIRKGKAGSSPAWQYRHRSSLRGQMWSRTVC
jgi:hypothetical protein